MTDNSARLDHVVLWVRDPVASADFYEKTVGLAPVRVAEYAEGKAPFPSVRLNEETILDLMALPMAAYMNMIPGAGDSAGHPVNHVCLSLQEADFDALHARLEERSVPSRGSRTTPSALVAWPSAAFTSRTRTETCSRHATTTRFRVFGPPSA